jgi:hypothetical protein
MTTFAILHHKCCKILAAPMLLPEMAQLARHPVIPKVGIPKVGARRAHPDLDR